MGFKSCQIEKIRWKDFGLLHDEAELFVLPRCGPAWCYILWLGLWTGYFIFAFFFIGFYYREWTDGREHAWIVYFSHWGVVLLTCTLVLDCLVTTVVYFTRPEITNGLSEEFPWYLQGQWVISNVNNTVAILITLIYLATEPRDYSFSSVNKHIINSVFVISNAFVSAKPVRMFHFYQPVIFVTSYMIFSLIYQKVGNKSYIYDYLDWENLPTAPVVCVVTGLVVTPGIHLILFSLIKVKEFVYSKVCLVATVTSRTSLQTTVERDVTATDVVLVQSTSKLQEIFVPPDSKDDINVHLHKYNRETREYCDRMKSRLYRSESDLTEYRIKHGINCLSFETEIGIKRHEPVRHIIVVKRFVPESSSGDLSSSSSSSVKSEDSYDGVASSIDSTRTRPADTNFNPVDIGSYLSDVDL